MREILFRARRVSDKKLIEGGIVVLDPDSEYVFISEPFYSASTLPVRELIYDRTHLVDKETVGQYTGLTDKNGKKIFEGDILSGFQYPYLNDGKKNYFAEVVWFDNSPAFGIITHVNPKADVRGISDGLTEYLEDFNPDDWEVIGNIFDNPELLAED